MSKQSGLNPNVHGARGLFSLVIFFYHVGNSGLPTFPGSFFVGLQQAGFASLKMGVELFFGISGLVIVGALGRASSFVSFLWDRVTRILPVLWATILVITAMSFLSGERLDQSLSLRLWLANFLAPPPFFDVPQVNPAAWSLGYEFTFYFLLGTGYFSHRRGVRLALPVTVVIGAVLLVMYPRSILMAAGVMIALGVGRTTWLRRWSAYPMLNLLLFIGLWRLVDWHLHGKIIYANPIHLGLRHWLLIFPGLLLALLVGTAALLGVSDGQGRLGRFLRSKAMMWLGTVSYSFYLWHPVMQAIAKGLLKRLVPLIAQGPAAQLALVLISLAPSLVLAHFSQKYIEVRLTVFLRRLGPDGERAKIPAAPTVVGG